MYVYNESMNNELPAWSEIRCSRKSDSFRPTCGTRHESLRNTWKPVKCHIR